ncbi:MAG: hypothetical protein HQ478_06000 [Chloroflexi bacterium]|nr:hypothetical protein [Chloroflexota bacterium]
MPRCRYWDCDQSTVISVELCFEHHPQSLAGLLDHCPDCGLFKNGRDSLCGQCARWDEFSVSNFGGQDSIEIDFDFEDEDEVWERSLGDSARGDEVEF